MSERRPVLLGGSGRLGGALLALFPEYRHPTHADVDVTDAARLLEYLEGSPPPHVIHAAAVVGRREVERDLRRAHEVNALGTLNVARACRKIATRLVYVSSAAVFGHAPGPHSETDPTGPTYDYGISKLLGELYAEQVIDHAIVRTDFFVPGELKHARALVDHYCSKLPVADVARALVRVAGSDFRGVIHVGGPRKTLFEILRPHRPGLEGIRIRDSSMPDFPPDLSLDCSLYARLFE